jgi:(4S)-4-hydroxy-5-phosphonooxypentane-2,3-dione isomerase
MLIVHVHVRVKPDQVEAFKAASLANAECSVREPGVDRFEVLQDRDDPARFVLVEIFRTPEAPTLHKQTPHYAAWRRAVEDMQAEPRYSITLARLTPSGSER